MKNFTDITIILDKSSSMHSLVSDVVGGFNKLVDDQRANSGECRLSLTEFSTAKESSFEQVFVAKDIKTVEKLTKENYQPHGMTALLDAIGNTINATGARLEAMKEEDRPEKVIIVIITDGAENDSRKFNRENIFSMIEQQKNKYSWDFVFLAANQDAIRVGSGLGITRDKALNFSATSGGTTNVFASASSYLIRASKADDIVTYMGNSFSADERKSSMDDKTAM